MESEDEFYNANDLSEDEYVNYLEEQKIEEKSKIEQEGQEQHTNPQDIKPVPNELEEFRNNLCIEVNQKSKVDKELREGGYFDFIFHLCKQLTYQHLTWNYEFRATVIMEIETFILLLQSREDRQDQALDPTIMNIKNLKNEALKNSKDIESNTLSRGVLILDRIIQLLERAKQWQKNNPLAIKDIYEKNVQESLKEIESKVNSLFRYTKEDKLEQCVNAMEELDRLQISPYWEESIYRYRLMYKELLWIKQELSSSANTDEDQNQTFDKLAEVCEMSITTEVLLKSDPIISGLKVLEHEIVNGGYFERRIHEIFAVVELQSKLDSDTALYKGLCTILGCLRKVFNYDLQQKNFVWSIDQLHQLVHKKCEEYFGKITQNHEDQELLRGFEWLQKTSFLLDEIRAWKNDPQRISKGDVQDEIINLKIEAGERKMFEVWFQYWSAKFTLNDLVQDDYQKIFQDLEKNIENVMEECVDVKSFELLERALNIKEICQDLIMKIQAEEQQIDWKSFRKRQFATKSTKKMDRDHRRW